MMGQKERCFAALVKVSLEELVPKDHFYRHLERTPISLNSTIKQAKWQGF